MTLLDHQAGRRELAEKLFIGDVRTVRGAALGRSQVQVQIQLCRTRRDPIEKKSQYFFFLRLFY